MKLNVLLFLSLSALTPLFSHTIQEKKESFKKTSNEIDREMMEEIEAVNQLLEAKRFELKQLYAAILKAHNEKSSNFQSLASAIRQIREEIAEIQTMWRDEASSFFQKDVYALWHQPETTLEDLVLDYGASHSIYLIPPEVGSLRLSLNSNLPIPQESFEECLELILAQYGVGIRKLNPYLKELYFLRADLSGIAAIVDSSEKLDAYPGQTPLCYILSAQGVDPNSDMHLLERFSNPSKVSLDCIGGKIFIFASGDTIRELLKLYAFAKSVGVAQEFQVITLSKLSSQEMHTLLQTAFHGEEALHTGSSLRSIPLQDSLQSLFLIGTQEEIEKATKLIRDLEAQIESPQEKTIFWYTAKHSDAEELATLLAKVYDLLVNHHSQASSPSVIAVAEDSNEEKKREKHVVPSHKIVPASQKTSHKTADGQNNFIVDPKTGAIIMVVEKDAVPKIKDLLKKLDVPKKMVQLEVLLFEKKISSQNKLGLNLMRLGDMASKTISTGLSWGPTGILEFLISRNASKGMPAYDLAYQFLLGQQDIQINASPSITTMNQTPATIAIVEEISIDVGNDDKNRRLYSRAEYGIIIQITPTINSDILEDSEDSNTYVTLDTDITFDTPQKSANDRPIVTRRHIKNYVRIADGETVILGGLRRKNTQDTKESLPFLGEIPGIGKLFSHTEMTDNSTEMFIFITPRVIEDSAKNAEKALQESLKKRPGDIPAFLTELVSARERQKKKFFEASMQTLFGRGNAFLAADDQPIEEYDGRQ